MKSYKNLKAEVIKAGLDKETLAEKLSLPVDTLVEKLTGEKEFCLNECLQIQSTLKNNLALEYLFECE